MQILIVLKEVMQINSIFSIHCVLQELCEYRWENMKLFNSPLIIWDFTKIVVVVFNNRALYIVMYITF